MIVIGVVGLISSGKTTVCEILSKNGYKTINLDTLSHKIYEKGSNSYNEIINIWGKEILDDKEEISRSSLSGKVFIIVAAVIQPAEPPPNIIILFIFIKLYIKRQRYSIFITFIRFYTMF